jgi:hypothetical protein
MNHLRQGDHGELREKALAAREQLELGPEGLRAAAGVPGWENVWEKRGFSDGKNM